MPKDLVLSGWQGLTHFTPCPCGCRRSVGRARWGSASLSISLLERNSMSTLTCTAEAWSLDPPPWPQQPCHLQPTRHTLCSLNSWRRQVGICYSIILTLDCMLKSPRQGKWACLLLQLWYKKVGPRQGQAFLALFFKYIYNFMYLVFGGAESSLLQAFLELQRVGLLSRCSAQDSRWGGCSYGTWASAVAAPGH